MQIVIIPSIILITGLLALVNSAIVHRSLLMRQASLLWLLTLISYAVLQYAGFYFGWPIRSVYAFATRETFLNLFIGFLSVQMIVSYVSGHRTATWFIIFFVVISGYLVSLQNLYWLFRGEVPLNLFVLHPNRNNVAAFLELIGPVALGVAVYRYRHAQNESRSTGAHLFLKLLTADPWFLLALSANLVMIAGAFASLSKFSLLTVPISYLIFFLLSRPKKLRGGHLIALALILILAVAFIYFFTGHLFAYRLNQAKAFDWQTLDMRIPFWERALPLAQKFLFFGSGLGTFSESFSSFHRVSLNFFSQHLLNDYLELVVEVGLVGLCIYFLFWSYFIRESLTNLQNEKSFFRRYLPIGFLCGVSSTLLRQAIMTQFYDRTHMFYLFLFVALVIAIQNEGKAREQILRLPKSGGWDAVRYVWIASMFALCVVSFIRGSFAVLFLGKAPIEMSYKRAFAIDSENADYPYALSKIYLNKASAIEDEARRNQKLNEARMRLEQAIQLNSYQLKYRIDASEIALQRHDEVFGDRIFNDLQRTLPFDSELILSRGIFWRKAALATEPGGLQQEKLARSDKFLNSVKSSDRIQSDFIEAVKEKRLSSLRLPAN